MIDKKMIDSKVKSQKKHGNILKNMIYMCLKPLRCYEIKQK